MSASNDGFTWQDMELAVRSAIARERDRYWNETMAALQQAFERICKDRAKLVLYRHKIRSLEMRNRYLAGQNHVLRLKLAEGDGVGEQPASPPFSSSGGVRQLYLRHRAGAGLTC